MQLPVTVEWSSCEHHPNEGEDNHGCCNGCGQPSRQVLVDATGEVFELEDIAALLNDLKRPGELIG